MNENTQHDTKDATDREFTHPLTIFPWFRNLPNKLWIAILLTGLFAVVIGVLFSLVAPFPSTVTDYGTRLRIGLSYSFAIGYSFHLISRVFVPTIRIRLRNRPFHVRLIANLAVWAGGAMMGIGIVATIYDAGFRQDNYTIYVGIGGALLLSVITGVALRQRALQEIKVEREKAEHSETQRTLAVSRLRLLQAQIEPHFLFNTLANVSSLIEVEPKQARTMLDQLTLLLRASLDSTRNGTTPLNKELAMIEAYLGVLKVRMGERLAFTIEAAPELLNLEVPSMLLQPIVENAVKHGIEPRLKGGTVKVKAQRENDHLAFIIVDNGVGFVPNSKENVGLGAVRERLAVQFGDAAALDIERTPDNWTSVSIRIPIPT